MILLKKLNDYYIRNTAKQKKCSLKLSSYSRLRQLSRSFIYFYN